MVNLFITMLLGGLWHGAAWHFVVWGIWHGMGLGIHRIWHERGRRMAWLPAWLLTQCFVLYGWLLFRAESLDQAAAFTVALGHYQMPVWLGSAVLLLVVCSLPLVLMQIAQVRTGDLMVALRLSPWRYAALVGALLLAIVFFWQKQQVHAFIYFQF
jgi:alginate O-acetyltransferase complex protein AlgI